MGQLITSKERLEGASVGRKKLSGLWISTAGDNL